MFRKTYRFLEMFSVFLLSVCLDAVSWERHASLPLCLSLAASKINAWLNRFTHIEQSHSKGDVTARGVERVAMVTGGPDWVGCRRKRSGVRGWIRGSERARARLSVHVNRILCHRRVNGVWLCFFFFFLLKAHVCLICVCERAHVNLPLRTAPSGCTDVWSCLIITCESTTWGYFRKKLLQQSVWFLFFLIIGVWQCALRFLLAAMSCCVVWN